jgi:hypothetical protein
MPYSEALLKAWESSDYSMLTKSDASDFIKRILITKAKIRPGRRFFGEAFIASSMDMAHGWYSSFKWLTAKKWVTGKRLESEFEKPFHMALMEHIGKDLLEELQKAAVTLFEDHKELFLEGKVHRKPVPPDLWLIDKDDHFKFIESKLPGDVLARHQIAGLALIEKVLSVRKPVSVSVVELYPEHNDPLSEYSKFMGLVP